MTKHGAGPARYISLYLLYSLLSFYLLLYFLFHCPFRQYTCFLTETLPLWLFLLHSLQLYVRPNRFKPRKNMTYEHPVCAYLGMDACMRYCTSKQAFF
jgi:energy-coupling factor transporter transmembrane protein EcfT